MSNEGYYVLTGFGDSDPTRMPKHLFSGALHIDYSTAVRADISKQDFSVCPRHWYVDATFRCRRCGQSFVFSAAEQRFWYEGLRFYVDSQAKDCRKCRRQNRELKALQQEYDHNVTSALERTASLAQKERLLAVLDALDAGGVQFAGKIADTRRTLAEQVERLRQAGPA